MQETPEVLETSQPSNATPVQSTAATNSSSKMLIGVCFVVGIILAGLVGYFVGVTNTEKKLVTVKDASLDQTFIDVSPTSESSPTLSTLPTSLQTYRDPSNIFAISYPNDQLIHCDYDNDNGAVQFWERPFTCEGPHDSLPLLAVTKTAGMTLAQEKQPDTSSKIMIKDMEVEKRLHIYHPEDGPLYGVGSKTQLLFYIPDTDQYISIELLSDEPEDINLLMSIAGSFEFLK